MKNLKKNLLTSCITGLIALPMVASADLSDDIKDQINDNSDQVEAGMKDVAKNLMAINAHRSLASAETLGGGVFGFEFGIDATQTDLDTDALEEVAGTNLDSAYSGSKLVVPRLSAAIGLPVIPLDFGITYTPDVGGASYIGAEVKYGLISGGALMPAVSISGNYSSAVVADSFDTTTYGADVTVSKGFGVGVKIIPYTGLGYLSSTTTLNDKVLPAGTDIKTTYDSSATKLFVGAVLQLTVINLVAQWDQIGDYSAVSAKVGIRF